MPRAVRNVVTNAVLVAISIVVSLLAVEGGLRLWSSLSPVYTSVPHDDLADIPADVRAKAKRNRVALTLPVEWARKPTKVNGAVRAFYWHGALHVEDANAMRRTTPFPPKRTDTYRVMVVGDSLTFGYGLDETDTFAALLNQWLGQGYRLEVLNLGVSGQQSEDIRKLIEKWLPVLRPELVLYAVCLNDFLPSRQGEYRKDGYDFPLPDGIKMALIKNTKLGALVSDTYDRMLRKLRYRVDFFDDVLQDFGGYQTRFRSDARAMNSFLLDAGLPPLVSMVVDQFPSLGQRGHQIAKAAEHHLRDAGAVVIDTEEFYRTYDKVSMEVSKWEGHPNEVANYIWARMLAEHLRGRQDVQPYKR